MDGNVTHSAAAWGKLQSVFGDASIAARVLVVQAAFLNSANAVHAHMLMWRQRSHVATTTGGLSLSVTLQLGFLFACCPATTSALSIAKITGIYEDDDRVCYVAVHYFWRWGQIHATYDLHDATRPYSRHQIFLQKEVLKNPMDINGEDLTTPVTCKHCVQPQHRSLVELVQNTSPMPLCNTR